MKTRLVTLCAILVFAVALVLEGFAVANLSADSASTTATGEMQENTNANTPRRGRGRRGQRRGNRARMMSGVPNGVEACLNHLAQMAAADPLIDYEGHPSEIVNNGLMWNDPKSKCSLGDDQDKRRKVFDLAKAWRMKDAAQVRSILQELGASSSGSR
jgi:hypothetical protein